MEVARAFGRPLFLRDGAFLAQIFLQHDRVTTTSEERAQNPLVFTFEYQRMFRFCPRFHERQTARFIVQTILSVTPRRANAASTSSYLTPWRTTANVRKSTIVLERPSVFSYRLVP